VTNFSMTNFSVDSACHFCHSTNVTSLKVTLRPGEPIFDQVVFAATKAFISGDFLPGQPFPTVRALAADLRIHPNTAHKIIQHLIQERFLEVRPRVGTIVAELPEARRGDRKRLLGEEVGQLVVEARRVGASLQDVMRAVEEEWAKLGSPQEANRR
jgi:GntR family transcriptional regulator